jgi:5-methylcytosine-specific restriction endonuclease McrA
LAEHPWCELRLACQDAPITARLATEVHHRQTIRNAPERRLDWSNLAAVCRPCHTAVRERVDA